MALALPPSLSSPSTPSSWRRGGSRSRSSHSSAPLLAPPPPAASVSLPRSCGGVGGGGRPGGRGGGGGWGGLRGLLVKSERRTDTERQKRKEVSGRGGERNEVEKAHRINCKL